MFPPFLFLGSGSISVDTELTPAGESELWPLEMPRFQKEVVPGISHIQLNSSSMYTCLMGIEFVGAVSCCYHHNAEQANRVQVYFLLCGRCLRPGACGMIGIKSTNACSRVMNVS